MSAVVGFVVARRSVGEDRQSVAVEHRPLDEIPELLRADGQLAASARMGADGTQMKVADGQVEACAGRLRNGAGPFDLSGIEVDMRVEVGDVGHPLKMGSLPGSTMAPPRNP